jgi:K+-transporting ATPase ATPase C chain
MIRDIRPALVLILAFTLITGLAYPLAITGIANVIFPLQAHGSLVARQDGTLGSILIGQEFKDPKYFHGRPSATTTADPNDASKSIPAPYNAGNSSGSNLAPSAKALVDRVKGDADSLAAENPNVTIPIDLLTTSASGLDPDITPAAAQFQVPRIAKTRGLDAQLIRQLIAEKTIGRSLGLFGEAHVNVLEINLALDALEHDAAGAKHPKS